MAMRSFLLQLTMELSQAVDQAAEDAGESRNAFIERTLWRSKAIRDAADSLGIDRTERRGRGRPRKDEE